jgi:hypothetical protein
VVVSVVEPDCVGTIGVSVERVSVAAGVGGAEEVSGEEETVEVAAPSMVGAAEPVPSPRKTAGVEVELTNGGAFSMYEPLGCTA